MTIHRTDMPLHKRLRNRRRVCHGFAADTFSRAAAQSFLVRQMLEAQLSIISITCLILLAQAVANATKRNWFHWLLALELTLCLGRNSTLLLQYVLPGYINCQALGIVSFLFYAIWVLSLDSVLYVRAHKFTQHPKLLTAVFLLLALAVLGIRIYTSTTFVSIDGDDGKCHSKGDFTSTSLYSLILRSILQAALLVPFLQRAYSYRQRVWNHFALVNGAVTTGIISLELISYALPRLDLGLWMSTVFTIINCLEANLVLFMVEDAKQMIKRHEPQSDVITIPTAVWSMEQQEESA
ncbi:hypothetical protein EDD86DRAFT_220515 [Gorgonomyces haynaldii]|nr:hypothetical protein EDD86DRAFT_220515 [Gorgonomyces haynaldii]